MPSTISRGDKWLDVAVNTAEGTTAAFDFQEWSGGTVHIPSGSSITSLTFYSSNTDGTFLPLYDSTGTAVTLTVAATRAYEMPSAIFSCGRLKMVGDAADTVGVTVKG